MNLNALKFGFATALSVAVLWIVCSILVLVMPSMMISMSGDMLHMDVTGMSWSMTITGAIAGLFAWSLSAGIFGWLLAAIYNRLV